MILRSFIILVLIDGYLSKQTCKSSSNCTISSENITLLNKEDFQYEVNVAFSKKSQGNSTGVISGTEIWCDDGNLHCPVVVEATLVSCGNSTSPTLAFSCSFNLNRTIRFEEAKIDLQIEVVIKNISDTQQNEALNFTLSTEFVKSLFLEKISRKVNVTKCASPTSIHRYTYSNGSYCPIENVTPSNGKDIQYQVIVDFDKSNNAESIRVSNNTIIFCDNGSSHLPIVAKATRAICDTESSSPIDRLFNSNPTIKCNKTKIDLQIKVLIKNISDTQIKEVFDFTLDTEFMKSLFLKDMPGKVNFTNCSLEATSTTPTPTAEAPTLVHRYTYSNGSCCPIENVKLFNSKDIQYQVIIDFDKRNNAESIRVSNNRNIFCGNGSSHFPIVAKATRANCDNESSSPIDCLFNSNLTIKCNETKIDLQIKVLIKNSDTQIKEVLNFTLNTEFMKSFFLKNTPGKVNVTNCSLTSTPTTFIPTPFSITTTKSKSSNGKIALVVLAFFILLGVASITCYFKYKKKLSNRPACYNDISLNDPLHTEIKFYKADGKDVEDNVEDDDDDDDILPLI